MSYRSAIGRVRGLGSARSGTHHFIGQRLSAIALVPLSLWFVVSVVALVGADYTEVVAWLRSPWATVMTIALVLAAFYHAQLGIQVVLEDYVHAEGTKLASLVVVRLVVALLGLACVVSVLRVAFGAIPS